MYHVRETMDIWPAFDLIDDQKEALVRVVPARGGLVSVWEVQGQSLLYLDRETYGDPQKNVRGGIPILFPICGRLSDDKYTHNGKVYHMPQHGLARRMPWSVQSTATENGATLRLFLESDEQTKASFPFDFRLEFEYRLIGDELVIAQAYYNNSQEPMPLYPGLHPYFAAANKELWQLRVPAECCHDLLTGELRDVSEAPDWEAVEQNFIYSGLSSGWSGQFAALHRNDGTAISIGYSREFRRLVFWTLGSQPFICLEPCVAAGDLLGKVAFGADDAASVGSTAAARAHASTIDRGAPLWLVPGSHIDLNVRCIFHHDGRKP